MLAKRSPRLSFSTAGTLGGAHWLHPLGVRIAATMAAMQSAQIDSARGSHHLTPGLSSFINETLDESIHMWGYAGHGSIPWAFFLPSHA